MPNSSRERQGKVDGILIAGPTASGKSALALALADRIGGAIINADAMQSFREVRILSARPSQAEEKRVSHHLYGYLSAQDDSSVASWMTKAKAIAEACSKAGRIPILVGGASLYITCFDRGMAYIPPTPPEIRQAVRKRMASKGLLGCYQELQRVDPDLSQRIAASDRQRICRGLEVWEATAKPLSLWQEEDRRRQPPPTSGGYVHLLLAPERTHLYQCCENRFDDMMEHGALDEVASLRDAGEEIPSSLRRIHGVSPLESYLRKECSLSRAVALAKQHTRNYAKRQTTWARHRLGEWHRLDGIDGEERLEKALLFLTKAR